MSASRSHAQQDALYLADAAEAPRSTPATCAGVQRRERRALRQSRTRPANAELLHQAMRVSGVSRQQFADWVGLSKTNVDAILAAEKPLSADDLLTPHPGVRRVAKVYLQLIAAHVGGGEVAEAPDVPLRERATLTVEALGDLLRAEREAMRDGSLDVAEARELLCLAEQTMAQVEGMRDLLRALVVSR